MKIYSTLTEKFANIDPMVPRDMVPSLDPDNQIKDDDNPDITEYMRENGWDLIGHGQNAMVFGKEGERWVLRLTAFDPGYVKFWNIARRSDNPHFPEVSRFGKYTFMNDEYHVCFVSMVERLQHKRGDDHLELIRASRSYFTTGQNLPEEIASRYPLWQEALKTLTDAVQPKNHRKYSIDLHTANVMYRGSVPVIVDLLL